LSLGLVGGPAENRFTLSIQYRALPLKLLPFRFSSRLRRRGVRQFGGNALLSGIDCIEDGFVQKALEQPHENEKVQDLRPDGEPIDEHESLPAGLSDDVIPERVCEQEI